MELLPLRFSQGRFPYTQVRRTARHAIYRQQHEPSGVSRYEVIRILAQRAHTWPTGQTTPEKEAYPGSTAWGRQGWTCFDLPEAEALLARLSAHIEVEPDGR